MHFDAVLRQRPTSCSCYLSSLPPPWFVASSAWWKISNLGQNVWSKLIHFICMIKPTWSWDVLSTGACWQPCQMLFASHVADQRPKLSLRLDSKWIENNITNVRSDWTSASSKKSRETCSFKDDDCMIFAWVRDEHVIMCKYRSGKPLGKGPGWSNETPHSSLPLRTLDTFKGWLQCASMLESTHSLKRSWAVYNL